MIKQPLSSKLITWTRGRDGFAEMSDIQHGLGEINAGTTKRFGFSVMSTKTGDVKEYAFTHAHKHPNGDLLIFQEIANNNLVHRGSIITVVND